MFTSTIRSSILNAKNTCKWKFYSTAGIPELSKNRYNVKRKEFNVIHADHVTYFKNLLGSNRVLTDPSELLQYNVDWIKNCRADIYPVFCMAETDLPSDKTRILNRESQIVLKPNSTEEVSKILSFCNENNLAVCPQGGNTGLVGGSVPVFDEIIVNMSLMNKIISLDEISGILVCEAGCILETLDLYAREHKLMMPLDLGAKGSCHIGGNVSTNAGGLRLLRYGNLHGSVMGVEAVKADGEIVDCLGTLKKDNTGFHLKHLFIGSEGTLGVVTKVSINCPSVSSSVNIGFLGVSNFENVLQIYLKAKQYLGEIISAFEMADAASLQSSIRHTKINNPIGEFPFYVIIETSGSNDIHDAEKLAKFLEEMMSRELVEDGTLCSEITKIKNLWALRENIPTGVNNEGYVLKYDISLPLKEYYNVIPVMKERLKDDDVKVFGYGHIGDGNIHLNIALKEYSAAIVKKIEPFVYEHVSKLNGSISSEHGIGFKKPQFLHYSKSKSAIRLMKDIKSLMDPKGILNPYKVLPDNV